MNWKVKCAKNTRLGRVLCRLLGDRVGGVMMEYVILGVMIAAAVVVAVALFGRTIAEKLGIMTEATGGNTPKAEELARKSRENATQAVTDAENSRKAISPAGSGGSGSSGGGTSVP